MNKFQKIICAVNKYRTKIFYGFLYESDFLTTKEKLLIKKYLLSESDLFVRRYERKFSKIIGSGKCVSYATARMGFYDLLKLLDVGHGDQVILLGSTCAVMPSAVIRCGATPVFTDIDQKTLGSDPYDITKKITNKTKVIVAQHSFGIPCNIGEIQKIAKDNKIFLIEDCALALDSKLDNINVGNFGDASIFSTDHSKPFATFIGGMVYTNDYKLANKLLESRDKCPELSNKKKKSIYNEIIFEQKYCNPKMLGKKQLVDICRGILRKIGFMATPFILDENCVNIQGFLDPYPAKLPSFIAILGILKLKSWNAAVNERRLLLDRFVDFALLHKLSIPNAYTDKRLFIVPLRLVWVDDRAKLLKEKLVKYLDVSLIWFMRPVISTEFDLSVFGYVNGSCPVAERTGQTILNIPSNLPVSDFLNLLQKVDHLLYETKAE